MAKKYDIVDITLTKIEILMFRYCMYTYIKLFYLSLSEFKTLRQANVFYFYRIIKYIYFLI